MEFRLRDAAHMAAVICLFGCISDAERATFDEGTEPDATVADGARGEVDAEPGPDALGSPDSESEPDSEPRPAPDPDPPARVEPVGEPAGAACETDDDCASGLCLDDDAFPGGACTTYHCDEGVCADADAVCVAVEGVPMCMAGCNTDYDCRDGYACRADGLDGGFACVPALTPTNRVDGTLCERDEQCAGGGCLTDWPGGYCTTVDCRTFEDCARGDDGDEFNNRCFVAGRGENFCVRLCEGADDCRAGYVCQRLGRGAEGVCFPNPNQPLVDPGELAQYPFDITCQPPSRGSEFQIDFSVAPETTAYMLTPFSADGQRLESRAIETPAGLIDFGGANEFQALSGIYFGGINPTVVPAHADFADQLVGGDHTYVLDSGAAEVCSYLLEEESWGTTIDLNVYLAGVPGITPENAARHGDLQAVLAQFEHVYAQAEIELGEVRYYTFDDDVVSRYAVIRSEGDVGALVEHTAMPGPSYDEALSLNVVFTRQFSMGGAIGISLGLPGPAALHGTRMSGVVFTGEFIGSTFRDGGGNMADGNVYTGNVLAHEVGHYLGLFHTSEVNGASFDPLRDTDECRSRQFPEGCPDITNLMFPLARSDNGELSPLQASVVRANPLTKE